MSRLRRRTIGILLGGTALAAILPAQPVESADTFELSVGGDDLTPPIDRFSAAGGGNANLIVVQHAGSAPSSPMTSRTPTSAPGAPRCPEWVPGRLRRQR